jgi:hypothetical protein
LNSPWGVFASVCAHFHWKLDYLLWGIAWVNVQMMLADMPRYDYKGKSKEKDKFNSEADLVAFMNSKLKK